MAEKLWNKTTKDTQKNQWTAPSEQIIRGLGGIKKTKRTLSTALTQKYIKIVLETAWLLWKARNERVIGEREIKKEQLKRRWVEEINKLIEQMYTQAIKTKDDQKRKKAIKRFKEQWTENSLAAEINNKGRLKLKEWEQRLGAGT